MVQMKSSTKKLATLILMIVLIGISLLLTLSKNRTFPSLYSKICIFIIAALSLNIVCGNLGELVLGHGGFMLVGYCVAYVLTNLFSSTFLSGMTLSEIQNTFYSARGGLQPLGYGYIVIVTLISGVATGVIGLVVGLIVMGRLKGDYLAIVTLGIGLIFVCLAQNIPLIGTQSLSIISTVKGSPLLFTIFMLLLLLVSILFITSRFGRGIIAIREDPIAAESSGIPVNKYKIMAFTFSALLIGMAGALYCFNTPQIAQKFDADLSIELMLMIVLGGLGSFTGVIVAVPLLIVIKEYVLLNLPSQINQKMVYGVILLVVMLFRSEGLLGTKEFSWEWLRKVMIKIFCKKKKNNLEEKK